MSKVIDITDKLNFDENPRIRVKGVEIEVSANAVDLFKVMALMQEDFSPAAVNAMFEILFDEENREKVRDINLSTAEFSKFIFLTAQTVLSLDNGETEGEAQTPATT